MRIIVVILALLISKEAAANQCLALQRFVTVDELPLGCPLVVYQDHLWHADSPVPRIIIERGNTYTDTLPTATFETELLDVYMETIDEQCVERHGYEQRAWDRITLDVAGVQVGDIVSVSYGADVTITAAGPCPDAAPPTNLSCQDGYQDYAACGPTGADTDDDGASGYLGGGCSAGGGLGLGGLSLLLGLRRRRTRR